MDLNKLSYNAYGNLVISILILLCLFFTLFPFNFAYMQFINKVLEFLVYIAMIPIYLYSRAMYNYPIHLVGLNKCFVFTISFYILLDILIYIICKYVSIGTAALIGSSITLLATYFTSELTNIQEAKGKLFWGERGFKRKDEPSKYQDLMDYIKFKGLTDEYLQAEAFLEKRVKPMTFKIYQKIFLNGENWADVEDDLEITRYQLSNSIQQCYNLMVGRLGI